MENARPAKNFFSGLLAAVRTQISAAGDLEGRPGGWVGRAQRFPPLFDRLALRFLKSPGVATVVGQVGEKPGNELSGGRIRYLPETGQYRFGACNQKCLPQPGNALTVLHSPQAGFAG